MKPSLQLKIGQHLTMTPQLQQAIRLLQLPVIDLQSQIQDALEENMMLEAVEEAPEAPAGEDIQEREERAAADVEATWSDTSTLPILETTWSSHGGSPARDPAGPLNRDFAPRAGESLQSHLLWQLQMGRFDAQEFAIGRAIIDAINDDGYLQDDLAALCDLLRPEIEVGEAEVESVLLRIQQFDPVGVGCRDIAECLEIQLDQLDEDTPGLALAKQVVREGLDDMAEHRFPALRRRLNASEEEFESALALVRSLHPRPGSAVHANDSQYVIPDVFVRKIDSRWIVEVNGSIVPQLRVNKRYAGLITRTGEHAVLKTQLQEARWLVRSLEIRNETLMKVATAIVERQHEFLEHGEESMRPMILRDVAEALDMHESTISRVTTGKYMHTPRGVIEFRYFFSSHVDNAQGEEVSSTAIRAMIRKLISNEDPARPLSDNKIAKILAGENVSVARRTVAKYRESMSIPSSSERKRLGLRH